MVMMREQLLELSYGGKRKSEVANQLQSLFERVHQPTIDLEVPLNPAIPLKGV